MSFAMMTYLPLIFVLIAMVAFGPRLYKMFTGGGAEKKRLFAEGTPARATVQQIQMGSGVITVGAHRHLNLRIMLQVEPPNGAPSYQIWTSELISELQIPQIQPGVALDVRLDPRDSNKLAIVGVVGGMPIGSAGGASAYTRVHLLMGAAGLAIGLFYAAKVAIGF